MSRTKRTHWLREEMRDGVKRPHIKRKKEEDVRINYMDYTPQELSTFVPDTELSNSFE